jgi:hypothetical protein
MAILTKGQTFANADSVTSTKLNNLVDAAAFVAGASGTTDNTSLEVNGSGRLQVKDLGVTSAKLAASAVTTTKLPDSTLATDGVTYAKLQRVANMKALGNVSGSLGVASEVSILDEDDMVSNSATSLATQQSIKAYTDASFVRGTALATTSGTSIDFTGIPSTVKRITVIFNSVSGSGSSPFLVQLGSGSIQTSGYTGSNSVIGVGVASSNFTNGIGLTQSSTNWNSTRTLIGNLVINNISSNIWCASAVLGVGNDNLTFLSVSSVSLSGVLDRLRLTTNNGTDTFDAGSVNIMYE